MNDKQKQIEEMVEIMCDDFGASFFAEKLYDAGYRKQSDTAREILQKLIYNITANNTNDGYLSESIDYSSTIDDIKELAAEYDVEVQE